MSYWAQYSSSGDLSIAACVKANHLSKLNEEIHQLVETDRQTDGRTRSVHLITLFLVSDMSCQGCQLQWRVMAVPVSRLLLFPFIIVVVVVCIF